MVQKPEIIVINLKITFFMQENYLINFNFIVSA